MSSRARFLGRWLGASAHAAQSGQRFVTSPTPRKNLPALCWATPCVRARGCKFITGQQGSLRPGVEQCSLSYRSRGLDAPLQRSHALLTGAGIRACPSLPGGEARIRVDRFKLLG